LAKHWRKARGRKNDLRQGGRKAGTNSRRLDTGPVGTIAKAKERGASVLYTEKEAKRAAGFDIAKRGKKVGESTSITIKRRVYGGTLGGWASPERPAKDVGKENFKGVKNSENIIRMSKTNRRDVGEPGPRDLDTLG